jgi:hypothetical protein
VSPRLRSTEGPPPDEPTVVLTPTSGSVGSNLTANGSGFAPSAPISLLFNSTQISSCELGSLETDAHGNFSCRFSVPAFPFGEQTVLANDTVHNGSAFFEIEGNLTLLPPRGSVGETIQLVGSGLPSDAGSLLSWNSTTDLCSGTTEPNGSFDCSFSVPPSFGGPHEINLTVASSLFETTFDVHPSAELSADEAQVGDTITATGNGFSSRSNSTSIEWDHGNPSCVRMTPVSGEVSCALRVPTQPGGEHNVTFNQSLGSHEYYEINESLNVSAYLDADPDSGLVGTAVTLSGNGFGSSTTYTACLQSTDDAYCPTGTSFSTSSNGTIRANSIFDIPSRDPGVYYLVVSLNQRVLGNATFAVTRAAVNLTPVDGLVGSSVSIAGSGFVADTYYNYCFQASSAACPADSPSFESNSTGGTTPPSGVAPSLAVPTVPGGKYHVDVSYLSTLVGSAQYEVESNVSSSEYTVTVGTNVLVTGSGFSAETAYSVGWDSGPTLCAGDTTNGGTLACEFAVPPSAYGSAVIETELQSTIYPVSVFVLPLLTVAPESGPAGTSAELTASGFLAHTTLTVNWTAAHPVCSGTTNISGSFDCTFMVPATPAGVHPFGGSAGASSASSTFRVTASAAGSPSSGVVGSTAELAATGFDADAGYVATWNGSVTVCSGTTDSLGNLSCSFTVPVAPGGIQLIEVREGTNSATVRFTVLPSILAVPSSGPVGSRSEVVGYGLVPGAPYTVAWNSSVSFCSGAASGAGTYYCNFTVPFATSGAHNLTTAGADTSVNVTFVIVPSIALSVTTGIVGTSVEVVGDGFDSGAAFDVTWVASASICSGITNTTGGLGCTFAVPASPGGVHSVGIIERSNSVNASFRVAPSISIAPAQASVGATVVVTGEGFAAISAYAVTWTATGILCSGTTNSSGGFACPFVVPSVGPGTYTILGTQGASGPAATFVVSSASAPSPFPWWIVVAVVIGAIGLLLVALYLRRRRSSARRQPVEPWREVDTQPTATRSPTTPVPLNPTPVTEPLVKPSTVDAATATAESEPEEDVDALIARLDRMAEQMFKKKPPVADDSEDAAPEPRGQRP